MVFHFLRMRSSLPTLDLVTPCRNRIDSLKNSLPSWAECDLIRRIIVVDFSSTKQVIEELDALSNPRLTVVRVEDEPLWRQGRAQNVGLGLSDAELVIKIDADVSIVDISSYVMAMKNDQTLFFTGFSKQGTSSGLCLARNHTLKLLGGYHDHMSGWGGDDVDLYRRLKSHGLHRSLFKPESFAEQGQRMATKNSEAPRLDSTLVADPERLARKPYFTGFRNTLIARIHKQNKRKALRWAYSKQDVSQSHVMATKKAKCSWRLELGRHNIELANILSLAFYSQFESVWELIRTDTFKDILARHQLPSYQGITERDRLIQELPVRRSSLRDLANELGLRLLSSRQAIYSHEAKSNN
jgi:glycosyltransferase involved in cell wall biosynthesis